MFAYIWPMALIVLSNTVYQICTKSVPESVSPFASLTVTYLVAAAFCALAFFVTAGDRSFTGELGKVNWASVVLGIVIVGLEVGWIIAYKVGWPVSTSFIVQSAFLAAVLIAVGALLYREPVSWNKLVGVGICMVGLYFINMK